MILSRLVRIGAVDYPLWLIAALGTLIVFLVVFALFIILLRRKIDSVTQTVQESEARYRGIFENSPVSLWFEDFSEVKNSLDRLRAKGVTDLETYIARYPGFVREMTSLVRVLDVNHATLILHEAEDKAALLARLGVTFNEESFNGFRDQLLVMWNGRQQIEFDTTIRTLKGTDLEIALRWRVMPGSESSYARILLMMYDITERKKMGEILQRTAKLDSLAVLAGGIAHDFNNLLGGLFGYLEMARRSSPDDSKTALYLDKSMQAFERAKNLTQQLLTFSKGGRPMRKIVSLAPLLRESIAFALSGSSISSTVHIPDTLWKCAVDEHQVGQVIDNIIINAKQAMPAGGTITVEADNYYAPVHLRVSRPDDGRYVRVTITDTGSGIARDVLERIFDPFFTTKQKGYGLGLATCYSIMKNHDGHIDVTSEEGKGATFTLYFPVSAHESEASDPDESTHHSGSGRVLVMDDEDFNREIVRDMLQTMGYSVSEASDGAAAIQLVRTAVERNEPFDVVLLDLTIPGGMGGKDAVAEIRRIHPPLPVFASSGYSDDPVMADPEAFGFTDRLPKPFRYQDMAQVLNRHMKTGAVSS